VKVTAKAVILTAMGLQRRDTFGRAPQNLTRKNLLSTP
jgi:hypothetical protein